MLGRQRPVYHHLAVGPDGPPGGQGPRAAEAARCEPDHRNDLLPAVQVQYHPPGQHGTSGRHAGDRPDAACRADGDNALTEGLRPWLPDEEGGADMVRVR